MTGLKLAFPPSLGRGALLRPLRILRILGMSGAVALSSAAALAQPGGEPQYGGTLNISIVYALAPLSFDNADWAWKFNQDMGLTYELLLAADLRKSKTHGGPYDFTIDAWIPPEAVRGELAESWQLLQNPPGVEFQLRQGIMFPAKKGIMAARELTAEDVVYSFNRYNQSQKRIDSEYDHIDKVEATGKHTVRFTFKRFNAEWDYRFGWGYYSAIVPKEVVDAGMKNWRNANGTGPYSLKNYVQGNTMTFVKNPDYWDSVTIGAKQYKLPFADTINYRIIRDESSQLTALRTARLDILESVQWTAVAELKQSAPQLQWNKRLTPNANTIALRMDTKPFDDVRVRRALNMAVDRKQIIESFFEGNAEALAYPMHPDYGPYYEPLEQMPAGVRELFSHQPDKAKQLLAQAGYPDGFRFKVQTIATNTGGNDLLALVASHLAKVGVTMEIEPMEYPAYLSAMTSKTHTAGYFYNLTGTNPTATLRKAFMSDQPWNASLYSNADFDARIHAMLADPSEASRQQTLRAMTREILEEAPHIWLPMPYTYTAWWPWVKNYSGELRAGAERPGPIHARAWIDQKLKKEMGF